MPVLDMPVLDSSTEHNIEIHNLASSSEVESKYQAIENEGFQVIYDVICISETLIEPLGRYRNATLDWQGKHSDASQLNCA